MLPSLPTRRPSRCQRCLHGWGPTRIGRRLVVVLGLGHGGVQFLLFAWPVFAVAGVGKLLPGPAFGVLPSPFGEPSLDVGEGPRKREDSLADRAVGFVVENHLTLWESGSSAASLAHSLAISFLSMPWWLGHHRISTLTLGSLARRVAMRRLASRAYFCPGPGGGHPSYGHLVGWHPSFFFVSSFIACDLSRSWQYTQIVRFPRYYGSS